MGTITGAVMRVARSGRGLLPAGQLLMPQVWERRHRGKAEAGGRNRHVLTS